jgi:hypothetical protein
MSTSLADTLAALARAFEQLGVDWYLFGAQAAILRGSRRMTADVDVTIIPGGHESAQILAALAAEGIASRVQLDEAFVEQTRVLPLIHHGEMPVDVVVGGPGLDEYFHERGETLRVAGVQIRVPCREDLICMKLLAGRPQDLQDAEAMARAGRVDLDEVRNFVEGMAQALGDNAIRENLDALLAALR